MSGASDPRRWASIAELFHQALDTPPERRAAFLEESCGDDEALRGEVRSLLEAHERAGGLLDAPAVTARDLLADGAAQELVGRELGHYRIRGVLGRGGMGVVYLADDTRLGRPVALKALPSGLTREPERRARLRREARAAAALSHPGIATVYALEEIDDDLYIAAELVPGPTLREELADGPLTVARARQTGLDIARALAAAHDRGIVHRDLKPENVVRTPSGSVKILDFGVARVLTEDDGNPRLTGAGGLLGTPAYMAPEQLRGDLVDARADVFAFGVLLHELLTGALPSAASDDPWTAPRALDAERGGLAPPARDAGERAGLEVMVRVIRRCLRQDARARYASASEVVAALEGRAPADEPDPRTPDTGAVPSAGARWWWQFHLWAASVGHVLLLLPLWLARQAGGPVGLALFLPALVAALAGSLLRLHLLFAARSYPAEADVQRRRTRRWIVLADLTLVVCAASGGLLVLPVASGLAILLVSSAVAVLVASAIVEPATTRAAFERMP
jgi:serine/threonine protein kinase